MTGIERLLTKTSNATAQALMGMCAVVDRGVLERAREEALEEDERRFHRQWQEHRTMVHYGCE